MTVSVNLVIICVFATLTLLCAAANIGMRRQTALGWLAAGLLVASVEAWLLGQPRGAAFKLAAITVMVPAAYLCVARSIRAVAGGGPDSRLAVAAIAALTAVSLGLIATGAPFIVQTLPFQAACVLAIAISIGRQWRSKDRNVLDLMLIAVLAIQAGIFAIRIPLFPMLFAIDAPYAAVASWPVEKTLLTISGLSAAPAVFLLLARIIGSEIATYRNRSERDGLTGLLNRGAFDRVAEARTTCPGAVIFCDIDHFKRVNDRYGHLAGDGVIRAFAAILQASGHQAGRMGGEEFALLLPGATDIEASQVADLIRLSFCHAACDGVGPGHRLSASFGVAGYRSGEEPRTAFVRADAALYRAKEGGRNRVVAFAESEEDVAGRRRSA